MLLGIAAVQLHMYSCLFNNRKYICIQDKKSYVDFENFTSCRARLCENDSLDIPDSNAFLCDLETQLLALLHYCDVTGSNSHIHN